MANCDLSLITGMEDPASCETYEVTFASTHSVGDIVKPDGAISGAITDVIGGVVVRAGDAAGAKTLVLRRGVVRTSAAHGLAANAICYSDGDNTASDAEPAGAAGTRITELGVAISTTRLFLDVVTYEKGA